MSEDLQKALAALKEKVGEDGIESSVRFDFTDLGALRLDAEGPRIDDGSPADCTITATTETFRSLFDGALSPTAAFMSGRLRIEGDMGVAMKMASLLG